MAWTTPEGKIQPLPITGYITITDNGYSFTRQKKVEGLWCDHPSFKTYDNGFAELKRLNAKGYGVYIRPNQGGNYDGDIRRCPTLFFEFDSLDKAGQWQVIHKLRLLGFAPSCVTETYKSLHTYFRIIEDKPEGWRKKQQRLIQYLGSDPSIYNEGRLMRLCGFDHWRYDAEINDLRSFKVQLKEFNSQKIYSRNDFDALLPKWDEARWTERKSTSKKKNSDRASSSDPLLQVDDRWDFRNFMHHLEGFNPDGRSEWATCRCPHHNGESSDSLHVNKISGAYKCHDDCDSKDIYRSAMKIARSAGYKFPGDLEAQIDDGDRPEITEEQKVEQQERKLQRYEEKVNREQRRLNSLTIKPNWTHIECHGKHLDDDLYQRIPASGLVFLKCGMGSGKTTLVKNLVRLRFQDNKSVFISPTIALCIEQAEKMKTTPRHEVQGIRVDGYRMLVSASDALQNIERRVSTCFPSLWQWIYYDKDGNRRSNFERENLIVVLDEVRGGLYFLVPDESKKLIQWLQDKILLRFSLTLKLSRTQKTDNQKIRYYKLEEKNLDDLPMRGRSLVVLSLDLKIGLNPDSVTVSSGTSAPGNLYTKHAADVPRKQTYYKTAPPNFVVYSEAEELPEASTPEPLFSVGDVVECEVDGCNEVGLVADQHFYPNTNEWVYSVEISEGEVLINESGMRLWSEDLTEAIA